MALIYAQIDCDLPRDRRMIQVGPLPRLLYIQFVLYCRENLTDGEVDRVQLPFVATDIPKPLKHIDALLAVGALESTDDGWRIPMTVWRKRNPLRTEVNKKRQDEAERKQGYRDRKKSDAVPLSSENVPTGQSVTATRCPRQEETETETEPKEETEPKPSSSRVNLRVVSTAEDERVVRTFEMLADEWTERFCTSELPNVRRAYRYKIVADAEDHMPILRHIAATRPAATVDDIANAYTAIDYDTSLFGAS